LNQFQAFDFAESSVGDLSGDSPLSVLFQNIGNQTLSAIAPGLVFADPNFSQTPGPGTVGTPADCTASFSLLPGAACNLSVNFDPMSTGTATGYADFYDNNLNNSASIQVFPFAGTGDSNGIEYSLSVAIGGSGGGSVVDKLTATASGGASFLGWGGACADSGTNSTCTVTMSAAQSVTAKFGQPSLGNIN